MNSKKFTFEELCTLSGLSSRTLRYYIQIGLVEKPLGNTRAAHYLNTHLEKILRIKQLTESGISLERIKDVLSGQPLPIPETPKRTGHIDVRSHVLITKGIEIQISPEEAKLSPDELRQFVKNVMQAYELIKKDKND